MDNQKDARTGSGWLRELEVDSARNRNLENWREARNRPGLRQRVQSVHQFRFGTGSQGINSRILLLLTTFVHFPLRASRAH